MKDLPHLVTSVSEYIRNNLDKNLNLKTLSALFRISLPVLQAGFKDKFNLTVHQYIMAKRMERAYRLIIKTDKPIKVIFQSVGFKSLSTFTNQFTKVYQMPPSELRRMNRISAGGSGKC